MRRPLIVISFKATSHFVNLNFVTTFDKSCHVLYGLVHFSKVTNGQVILFGLSWYINMDCLNTLAKQVLSTNETFGFMF